MSASSQSNSVIIITTIRTVESDFFYYYYDRKTRLRVDIGPKDVSSVLPESLTRRVQLISNEICKNIQILDSEDDTLGLDDVISILLPLEEVSSLLRDQEPVNGKTITYTTVLWCVRKCLGMAISKLRDERKVDDEDLKLLERSIRFASPISDEAPMLCVSESSDSVKFHVCGVVWFILTSSIGFSTILSARTAVLSPVCSINMW